MHYFALFLLVFEQWSMLVVLKLSISGVIDSLKDSNGDGKLHFFGQDYYFTRFLCVKIHILAVIQKNRRKHTPLYENEQKERKKKQ